jgi:hypothetical protein
MRCMRRIWLGTLVALSVLAPGAGMAQEGATVQAFLDVCNSPAGSPLETYCLGYVAGLGEMLSVNGLLLQSMTPHDANVLRPISMCGSPSQGAEVQAFKNWAVMHPEQWTKAAGVGVGLALRETWPCN